MKTNFAGRVAGASRLRRPARRSSANACIAASAPRPARRSRLLGEENDSPRGRIYLIKDMLENDRPADAETVKHVDRCLSCLSCMTTCPSGVNYMHLVDHARAHIAEDLQAPADGSADALGCLGFILPLSRPFPARPSSAARNWRSRSQGLFPRALPRDVRDGAPVPPAGGRRATRPAVHARRKGVASACGSPCSTGCAQRVLDPAINEATIRVLTRHGVEVVVIRRASAAAAHCSITWGRRTRRTPWPPGISGPSWPRSERAGSITSSSTRRAAARC